MITDVRRIDERSALRRWWRRLRIGALAGLLGLFVLEGLVRLIGIAPPIDRRKERFKSHDTHVIHPVDDFASTEELTLFVKSLKEARS